MFYQLHGPYLNALEIVPIGGIILDHSARRVLISNGATWSEITCYDDRTGLGPTWCYDWMTESDPTKLHNQFMEFNSKGEVMSSWYNNVKDPANFFRDIGGVSYYVQPNKEPKVPRVVVPLSTYKEHLQYFGKY